MAAVDFLHHENPPTWAEVEPATLGTERQRQTDYATQRLQSSINFWYLRQHFLNKAHGCQIQRVRHKRNQGRQLELSGTLALLR
ncbi:hypothetical protein TNCV_1107761 [Trichonephila clavipes]|nr:hypothetical protein TNCV_1107761 [Trichonephila clavipes]